MMNIQEACKAFQILLEEQQARIAQMFNEKVDFTTKKVVTIGVIDGDGIGPINDTNGHNFLCSKVYFFIEHLGNSCLLLFQ